jgi:hypothetical protein
METTEKIVESYCRYVKHWLTIPNIKCKGQYEIDLLAVDVTSDDIGRYHIECGVSISGSYSKLTAKPFSSDMLKVRVKKAGQRRTVGYFIEHKFRNKHVTDRLEEYGFAEGTFKRIIVTWGATDEANQAALEAGIEIWDFRKLILEIGECHKTAKTYFTDDTARTIQLFAMATN